MRRAIFMAIISVGLFYFFAELTIVPKFQLTELITVDGSGGSIEESHEFWSLAQAFEDLNCYLNCFPTTDKTKIFNISVITIAAILYAGLALLISYSLSKLFFRNKSIMS